ncbi:hypothetical protein EMIT0232MI5_30448 [Pseudomonas sp. IT-232MI5]
MIPRSTAAHGQVVELGDVLQVLAFNAIGDAFKLFRHVPHVVVIAAGDDARSPNVATVDDPGSQDEYRGFKPTPKPAGVWDNSHRHGPW